MYINGAKVLKGHGRTIAEAKEDAAKRAAEDWEAKSYYFKGIPLPIAKILPSPAYVEVGDEEEYVQLEVKNECCEMI